MNNYFERLLPIIGTEGLTKLQTSHVVVVDWGRRRRSGKYSLERRRKTNFNRF